MECVYLTSTQSQNIFTENNWFDFRVNLPKELVFKNFCECALLSFDTYPSFQLDVDIFCDALEGSCFRDSLAPFLAKISDVPYSFIQPNFIKVTNTSLRTLHFYIRTSFAHTIPTESVETVQLILLFRESVL